MKKVLRRSGAPGSPRSSVAIFGRAIVVAAIALATGFAVAAPASASGTQDVSVTVLSSTGSGIEGATVAYGNPNAGWYTIGHTDSSGNVTGDVNIVAGAQEFLAEYNHGTAVSGQVDISQPYTFSTVSVTLLNSGLKYSLNDNQGWTAYSGPMQMFPGTYVMNDNHGDVSFTVGTSSYVGGIVRLLDHTGNGLAGGTASYYYGGWYGVSGQTDANGNLGFQVPGDSGALAFQMTYAGTYTQQNHTQLTSSNFTFQTTLANVRLEDADGNPLDTGTAAYYAGGWRSLGQTSGGVISQEMMPGSWAFAMSYNNTREQYNNVAISGSTTDVVFQTGRLTAHFSQSFDWNNSEFYPFTQPTMEFLPGTIDLDFVTGCQVPVSIAAGDHIVDSGVVATLKDSSGHPLAGGVASVYAGGWQPLGTTGSNGIACNVVSGTLGNTSVAMTYGGTREQITQNQPTNSIYPFASTNVTVQLEDSNGNLMDTGTASYYAGGWHTIGDTSGGQVDVQMLPGSYSFAMTYNGTREQLNGVTVSGSGSTVTFQTSDVTAQLEDSNGNLMDTGTASYYAGGWHTMGDTSGGVVDVQMLPGSYSFAMTYNGTREQLNGVTVSGTASTAAFQTDDVAVQLVDSDGNPLDTGTASYYAGGWHTIGDTTDGEVDVQMLPGSYSFAMTYLGTREQFDGMSTAAPVVFATGAVHSTSGSATAYYAGGWHSFTQDMQLLPGKYTFSFNDGTANTSESLSSGIVNTIH